MRSPLADPARGVGDIVVVKPPFAAALQDLTLNLVIVLVVFADAWERGDFGLIVETADRHRPMLAGIADQELGALLHLGLGGASPFYQASLVNGGGHGELPSDTKGRRPFASDAVMVYAAFVVRGVNGLSSVLICVLRFTMQAKMRTHFPASASVSTMSSSSVTPTKIVPA